MASRPRRATTGITEPVPRLLQRVLREAVFDHVRHEQRRIHPSVLHVGVPGRAATTFEYATEDRLDHALRIEVVEAMLRQSIARQTVPLVWLTRRVHPTTVVTEDHRWATAARAAGGEVGMTLDLVVVTRHGWHDPRTGVSRTWKRPRDRTTADDAEAEES